MNPLKVLSPAKYFMSECLNLEILEIAESAESR
jgi:hypothetical protein